MLSVQQEYRLCSDLLNEYTMKLRKVIENIFLYIMSRTSQIIHHILAIFHGKMYKKTDYFDKEMILPIHYNVYCCLHEIPVTLFVCSLVIIFASGHKTLFCSDNHPTHINLTHHKANCYVY